MTYRVIQWATGTVGLLSLRQVIESPDLELAGVWVSGPEKDGKDAGALCGLPPTGVIATSSKDAIIDLDADVVIHTPATFTADELLDFDADVERLLASGKNVISIVAYHSPLLEGADRMTRLRSACEAGSSTLYGGGLDPGFVCDRVAALLSGSMAEIKQIRMIETIDLSAHPGAEMLSGVGMGQPPEEMKPDSPGLQYFMQRLLPGAVAKLADLLGITLEDVRLTGDIELTFAPTDLEVAMGTIKAGNVAGGAWEFAGIRNGEPFITHQWVHYMDRDSAPDTWLKAPPREPGGTIPYLVRIEIDGRPSLRTDMTFTEVDDVTTFSLSTAAACINAVPDVCAAPPGLLQEQVFGRWRR